MPKVVCIDNFGRDNISDRLEAENLTQVDAEKLAAELNARYGGEHSSNYYVVKPDTYVLFTWEP